MEEDEQARKSKKGEEKEEKGEVVSDKMNAEGDHMMDDARWKRKRGTSSAPVSAEETMKILRKLEREERKRKRDDGGAQNVDDVEVAGYAVNEEVMNGEAEGWRGGEVDGDELDPEQVKIGRKEELEFMVKKLDMFEFGTYEEAVSRGDKQPTTTKWVEGWKADDKEGRFVRRRLVEDLFAAMPPLESKRLMFRMVAAARGQRRRKGLQEVKLMFNDVRKAHLNARCEEKEWVELPEESSEYVALRNQKSSCRMGGRIRGEVGE